MATRVPTDQPADEINERIHGVTRTIETGTLSSESPEQEGIRFLIHFIDTALHCHPYQLDYRKVKCC